MAFNLAFKKQVCNNLSIINFVCGILTVHFYLIFTSYTEYIKIKENK